MLFNDATICFQQWQSCASCHPDGRADGLNWDLLNDGVGNPKNTKSLLLSIQTPPAMISGIRPDARVAVRAGMKFIQFSIHPEENATEIDRYLEKMKPVPGPRLENGTLSQAALRGKEIFKTAGCSSCHPAPLLTDMKKYNVGTGIEPESNKEFDTPTLVEAWRTAPYLYDGRAVSLQEVLTLYNKDDKHGKVSALDEQQLEDLIEYLLSI
jgi:cytochrome c peroxidase